MHVNLMTPYEVKLLEGLCKVNDRFIGLNEDNIWVFTDNGKPVNPSKVNPALRYIKVKRVKAMLHSYRLFSKT